MKIFTRTFLYTLTLLVLIALLANGLIYTLMPKVYTQRKQHDLTEQTNVFVKHLETVKLDDIAALMGNFASTTQANLQIKVGKKSYNLSMWSPGVVLETSETAPTHMTVIVNEDSQINNKPITIISHGKLLSDSIFLTERKTYRYTAGYSLPPTITERRHFIAEGQEGELLATITLSPVDEAGEVILSLLPISLLMCLIVAVIFSFLYARAITRPIKDISKETRRMTALEREARCHVNSKDEIGALATNVNDLYENLLRTIESLESELSKVGAAEIAKSDFLRAASHELKTPVTAVSIILDNIILKIGKYKNHEEWLPKCKELVDQLADMLRDILDASRLQDISEECATESIAAIGSEILESYAMIARAKGLSLYVDWNSAFTVTVPPKLLGKALSNVFSNAVQYTIPGGRLGVYCKGRSLIVENQCTPIPVDQLSRLSEPFYRPDASRSRDAGGNGLGLYITDTIMRLLQLDYSFEPMSVPDGMRFTIYF